MRQSCGNRAAITFILIVMICLDGLLRMTALYALTENEPSSNFSMGPLCHNDNKNRASSLIVFESMVPNLEEALLYLQRERKQQGRKATFLQIGANDGVTFDQLYPTLQNQKEDWMGLMVEPQPILFSKLVLLHSDAKDWSFYQGVVTDTCQNGTVAFCETSTPGVGDWKTQGQVNGIKEKGICEHIPGMVYVNRPCVSSFEELVKKGNGEFADAVHNKHSHTWTVDLIQIDAEGKDYDLIQMLTPNIRFTCINFEKSHMGAPERHEATIQKLGQLMNDTESVIEYTRKGQDTLACRIKK